MVDKLNTGEFEMLAKTMYGLEDVLQEELKALGAKNITVGRRMVAFSGNKELLYKANIHLRTALRILVPIAQFEADTPDAIYQYLYDNVAWDTYLTPRTTFSIDTVVYSERFTHSKFVAYRAKDAIADYFNDRADRRPNVSVVDPDVRFHIHIADNTVTVALDSSGESLHKRGYRLGQNEAPISEVLAAGILLKAGWSGQCNLLDPMCGSGTFLTEAALIALGIPPGIFRNQYAFERWADFDSDMLSEVLEDWEEKPFEYKIFGSDISPKAIAISRGNIKNAGITKYVELQVKAFEEYTIDNRPSGNGIIVMNPPYGERLRPVELEKLYSNIGSTLKHSFMDWKAWIISSLEEGFHAIALKHFHKEKLFNGMIECELRGYDLFEGKRNDHLENLSQQGLLPSLEEREQYYKEREALRREQQAFRQKGRSSRFDKKRTDAKMGEYNKSRGKYDSDDESRRVTPYARDERRRDSKQVGRVRTRHAPKGVFVPRDNHERRSGSNND